MQCTDEIRTALYRFYDSSHELLYVGISSDPWRRWREHVQTQPWYPQVKHWTSTWYDSEEEARGAELRAISGEHPRFNIAGVPDPVPVRFAVRANPAIAVCAAWGLAPSVLAAIIVTFAHWHWLVMVALALAVSAPVCWLAVLLVCFAPVARRFGAWLDRHVVWKTDLSVGTDKAKDALEIARGRRARVVPLERRQA